MVPSWYSRGRRAPGYVGRPYDDHRSVISTLTRTVGQGNFEVLAIAG